MHLIQILTHKAPITTAADDILIFFFLFFRENKSWHFIWIVCLGLGKYGQELLVRCHNI